MAYGDVKLFHSYTCQELTLPIKFVLANHRTRNAHVCSAHFCHLTTFVTVHQFCQFISTAFVNLTTFVNSELTSFVNNINHLCRYRRSHYFCQQGPTTLNLSTVIVLSIIIIIITRCSMRETRETALLHAWVQSPIRPYIHHQLHQFIACIFIHSTNRKSRETNRKSRVANRKSRETNKKSGETNQKSRETIRKSRETNQKISETNRKSREPTVRASGEVDKSG